MKIVAVDDRAYTHDRFEDAIRSRTGASQPIAVLVLNDDYYKTCQIDYHGGQRFPTSSATRASRTTWTS